MQKTGSVAAVIFLLISSSGGAAEHAQGMAPDAAVARLVRGNARSVSGKYIHPNENRGRRDEVAKGQHPFAVIVACSDSRVPPELVFDQGLGDLFVIRVAGNVLDDPTLGSIEYAVEHLGPRLVVVLGHERCGAVKAAVDGGEAPGHIASLVEAIKPAVEQTRGAKGDHLDFAVRANIKRVVNELRSSEPLLKEAVDDKKIQVIGMYYDLDTGRAQPLE